MALKTNQMQTDLKKYREEYDRVSGKKDNDEFLNLEKKLRNSFGSAKKMAEEMEKNKIKEELLTVIRSQTPMLPPICGNMSLCDYCKKDCIIFTTDDCDDFEYKGSEDE